MSMIPKRWLPDLAALLVAGIGLAALEDAPAQGPKGKDKGPKGKDKGWAKAVYQSVQGTVKTMTTAPKGEVDGVILLTDGTWVHWPPHLEDRFSSIAARATASGDGAAGRLVRRATPSWKSRP